LEGSIEQLHDDGHPLFGLDEHQALEGRRHAIRRARARRRRRHRLVPLLALALIAVVLTASYLLVRSVAASLATPDYRGDGRAFTRITVAPGDSAADIGDTLAKAGVVKSARAFVNAAKSSGQSADIQAGSYRVRLESSGKAAMAAILDPANRLVEQLTIPEGFTVNQVLSAVARDTGLSVPALTNAATDPAGLGVEAAYGARSVEGFLFPDTYSFNPGSSAQTVLQTMIAQFGRQEAKSGFQAAARAARLTPYDALKIASIAEAEAKYDADRARVARVIMNRIAARRPLQVDATSAYAAKLAGLNPTKVVYAELNSPYNSYKHPGLPPTPIGNPGLSSMSAAVHAPAGNWLYYVNVDAAGHLGFFTAENQFLAAVAVCKAKGWGCG
jgi:UPF0755 protein